MTKDIPTNQARLHIAQADDGFWMLSVEFVDGSLKLLSYQFPTPDHLIEDAEDLKKHRYPGATVLVADPRPAAPNAAEASAQSDAAEVGTGAPAPKKVGE